MAGRIFRIFSKKYEVYVDCITISKNNMITQKQEFENGLSNKVSKILDYRDLRRNTIR